MKIGWGDGNEEMKGFWRTEMYMGGINCVWGRENMKERVSVTLPATKVNN